MPSFEPLTPRPLTLLLRSSFFSHRPVVPQEGGQPVALHHVAHPEEARPVGLRAVVVAVVDHRVHRLVVDEEEVHPGEEDREAVDHPEHREAVDHPEHREVVDHPVHQGVVDHRDHRGAEDRRDHHEAGDHPVHPVEVEDHRVHPG